MPVTINGAFYIAEFKEQLFNKMKWERVHPKNIITSIRVIFPQLVDRYSSELMSKEKALEIYGIHIFFYKIDVNSKADVTRVASTYKSNNIVCNKTPLSYKDIIVDIQGVSLLGCDCNCSDSCIHFLSKCYHIPIPVSALFFRPYPGGNDILIIDPEKYKNVYEIVRTHDKSINEYLNRYRPSPPKLDDSIKSTLIQPQPINLSRSNQQSNQQSSQTSSPHLAHLPQQMKLDVLKEKVKRIYQLYDEIIKLSKLPISKKLEEKENISKNLALLKERHQSLENLKLDLETVNEYEYYINKYDLFYSKMKNALQTNFNKQNVIEIEEEGENGRKEAENDKTKSIQQLQQQQLQEERVKEERVKEEREKEEREQKEREKEQKEKEQKEKEQKEKEQKIEEERKRMEKERIEKENQLKKQKEEEEQKLRPIVRRQYINDKISVVTLVSPPQKDEFLDNLYQSIKKERERNINSEAKLKKIDEDISKFSILATDNNSNTFSREQFKLEIKRRENEREITFLNMNKISIYLDTIELLNFQKEYSMNEEGSDFVENMIRIKDIIIFFEGVEINLANLAIYKIRMQQIKGYIQKNKEIMNKIHKEKQKEKLVIEKQKEIERQKEIEKQKQLEREKEKQIAVEKQKEVERRMELEREKQKQLERENESNECYTKFNEYVKYKDQFNDNDDNNVIERKIYSSVSQSISVKSSELKNFSKYLSQKSFLFKDNTLYPILQSFDKSGYIIADSRLMNRQIEALGCIYYSFFKNHLLSHIWVSKTEIQWNNIKKYMSNNFDIIEFKDMNIANIYTKPLILHFYYSDLADSNHYNKIVEYLLFIQFAGKIVFDEWEEIYDQFVDVYNMNKQTTLGMYVCSLQNLNSESSSIYLASDEDLSYPYLFCMNKLSLFSNDNNDDVENNKNKYQNVNSVFMKTSLYDTAGCYFLKLYLKENGYFISRTVPLTDSTHDFILSKINNENEYNKLMEYWNKLAGYLKILLDKIAVNTKNKNAILKKFWDRYDEFVHLLNMSIMMDNIKKHIEMILQNGSSKIIIEYFISDFENIHQNRYPSLSSLIQEVSDKILSFIPYGYRTIMNDDEIKKRCNTCCFCNGIGTVLYRCKKCNMTSAHEYCLKQKGKDLNTFMCSICESNNNIYYEIFYNIVVNSQQIQKTVFPVNPIQDLIDYFKHKRLVTVVTGNKDYDTKLSNNQEIFYSVLITNDKSIYGMDLFSDKEKIYHLFLDITWDIDYMKRQIYISKSNTVNTSNSYTFFAIDSQLNREILKGINMEMSLLGSKRLNEEILLPNTDDYLFENTAVILKSILNLKYFVENNYNTSNKNNNISGLVKKYYELKTPTTTIDLFKCSNGLLNEGKVEVNYFIKHLKIIESKYQSLILRLLINNKNNYENNNEIKLVPCIEDIEITEKKESLVGYQSDYIYHDKNVKKVKFEIKNTISWFEINRIKAKNGGDFYIQKKRNNKEYDFKIAYIYEILDDNEIIKPNHITRKYRVTTPAYRTTITQEILENFKVICTKDAFELWNNEIKQTNNIMQSSNYSNNNILGMNGTSFVLLKCDFISLLDLLPLKNMISKYHIVRVIDSDASFTGVYIPPDNLNLIEKKLVKSNNSKELVVTNIREIQYVYTKPQQAQPKQTQAVVLKEREKIRNVNQRILQLQKQQGQKSEETQPQIQLSQTLQQLQKQQQQQQQMQQQQMQQQQMQQQQVQPQSQKQQQQQQQQQQQSVQHHQPILPRTGIEPFKVMSYVEISTRKLKKMVIEVAINNSNNNNNKKKKNRNNENKVSTPSSSPSRPRQTQSQQSQQQQQSSSKKKSKSKQTKKKSKSKEKELMSFSSSDDDILIMNNHYRNNSNIANNNNNSNNFNGIAKKRKESISIPNEVKTKRPKINLKIDIGIVKDYIINNILPKYIGSVNLNERVTEEVRKKYNSIFLTDNSLSSMVQLILNELSLNNITDSNVCNKCNNKNREGAKFCDVCGNKIKE